MAAAAAADDRDDLLAVRRFMCAQRSASDNGLVMEADDVFPMIRQQLRRWVDASSDDSDQQQPIDTPRCVSASAATTTSDGSFTQLSRTIRTWFFNE